MIYLLLNDHLMVVFTERLGKKLTYIQNEIISLNISTENYLYNALANDDIPLREITNVFMREEPFQQMKEMKRINEKSNQSDFEGFNDLQMIYYFVHQQTNTNEKQNRNRESNQEYMRELLQWYRQLAKSEEILRQDVKSFQEGSLLRNLRTWHIEDYQEWLQHAPLGLNGKPYAIATRIRKETILKSFLKWLYNVEYIVYPLHLSFKSTTLSESDIPDRSLSYHEVKQLLDFYKGHIVNYGILLLLATTGLRVREIANAKWCNLEYDSRDGHYYLHVKTKGNKTRDARIFENVLLALKEFRKIRGLSTEIDPFDTSPLLVTSKGKPYSYKYLSNYVTAIIKKTNLPFVKQRLERNQNITPHFFRHFFVNYCLEQGVDIFIIKETVGHSKLETTQRYVKKQLDRKNNAANQLKKAIF